VGIDLTPLLVSLLVPVSEPSEIRRSKRQTTAAPD
jgi:hypothetical protein